MTFIDVDVALSEFAQRVPGLTLPIPEWLPVESLRDRKSSAYGVWARSPGIYIFTTSDQIMYVGRALPRSGLRSRILSQVLAAGDKRWDAVTNSPQTQVGVLPLLPEDWYWVPSLEAFLIERLRPPINRKAC